MGLLNGEEILERLDHDEIFLPGTWNEERIRLAGYDLRVSEEVRALNETIYPPGHRHGEELRLEPGDTAYGLSYERFLMPWDLAANLGLRFRFARLGLSVLTGLLVDPGFGWLVDGEGKPRPQGAALHFFLVNISDKDVSIRLGSEGDEVLSVQFLSTQELQEKKYTKPPGDVAPGAALWAYRNMRQLEKKLADEKKKRKRKLEELEQRIDNLQAVVQTTRSATENIVVFGIFLVCVTLIGVSATILLQGLASEHLGKIIEHLNQIHLDGLSATVITLAGILVVGAGLIALIAAFTRVFSAGLTGRKPSND
ncbi:MAG TPA: hypothetical protein VI039_09030 [Solirubrobacterales bacterium]